MKYAPLFRGACTFLDRRSGQCADLISESDAGAIAQRLKRKWRSDFGRLLTNDGQPAFVG